MHDAELGRSNSKATARTRRAEPAAATQEVRVEVARLPDREVVGIVENTVWGSPGGLRYRNLDVNWWRLEAPLVVAGRTATGQVAQVIVYERTSWGAYLGLITTPPAARSLRLGPEVTRRANAAVASELPAGGRILLVVVASNTYAVRAMERAGFRRAATLESIPFTRRLPRRSPACERAEKRQKAWLLDELKRAGRSLLDANRSLRIDEYFLCYRNDQPVAGVQACPQVVEVVSLGSWLRDRMLVALPWLSGSSTGRLLVLQLHHAWGDPKYFAELWSHVLAVHDSHLAQIALDTTDPHYHAVRYRVRRGLGAILEGVEPMILYGSGGVARPISISPMMSTLV